MVPFIKDFKAREDGGGGAEGLSLRRLSGVRAPLQGKRGSCESHYLQAPIGFACLSASSSVPAGICLEGN